MPDIQGSSPAEQPLFATGNRGQSTTSLDIVCIGAGAGSLEALQLFFAAMPRQATMTIVICRQKHVEITDQLGTLLHHETSMPIHQAKHGAMLERNAVYVMPADARMVLLKDRLITFDEDEDCLAVAPLDLLFHALAASSGPRAIAVLLSGEGSEGLRGAVSIRRAGGLVLVQDPKKAGCPDRLNAVIEADLASAQAVPEAMPVLMTHFLRTGGLDTDVESIGSEEQAALCRIFDLLNERFCLDLDDYRRPMVTRRLRRRASLSNAKDLQAYAAYLATNDQEVLALHDEVMIGVTAFFRDPEAFSMLASKVVPALIERNPPEQPIRVWVPACSTGEEAYSLVMLITDHLGKDDPACSVEIVATDRSDRSLEEARLGLYHRDQLLDLPGDLRERYMEPAGDRLRVTDQIRDLVTFVRHDLIHDVPMADMDLVSCRNLLIYLAPDAREKALAACRHALTSAGFLFFGSSEMPGLSMDGLLAVDRRWRIYQKTQPVPASPALNRLPEVYRSRPAETIQSPADLRPVPYWPSLPIDDQPGIFDGMMEQNQQMLESTIDTLLASNDALRRRNRDLRLENQRLSAANTALEDIATLVAHDLKAPLRAIDHLASRLQAGLRNLTDPEGPEGDLRHMQLRLVGLHRLIDDLLTYARQDADDEAGIEQVELGGLIREVLVLIGLPPGFRLEVRPPSLSVRTRRIPLECILRNLLTNAIDHHGGEKGTIQITMVRGENALDISITDDGQGVTDAPEGLGLAIVRQLLAAEDGHLELAPRQDEPGSEARFAWPIDIENQG